jgi:hypothetical protein
MFFNFSNRNGLRMKSIFDMVPFMLYDGEEGAAAGAAVADSAPVSGGVEGFDSDIPVPKEFLEGAIESDPEYQELLKQEAELKKNSDKKPKDHAEESETAEEENAGAEATESAEGETEVKDQPDDKNSGEEDDFQFADDVIEGLKGEHLKVLPTEAKLAIAEYYGKTAEVAKERDALKGRLEELASDPVVKLREELLKQGTNQFSVRGITKQEKDALTAKMIKFGLNAEEAEEMFSMVGDTIEAVSKERAEDILHNRVIEEDQRRKTDQTITEGRSIFLKLGQFNEGLKFKETDANKFWKKDQSGQMVPDEKHPEYKKFAEKVLPVMEALGKAGINYGTLIKLEKEIGTDGVYAMLAKKHGLPVAINTGDRDRKIVQSELRKKMAPFLKGASSEELAAGQGKSRTPEQSAVMKHGYDITKLASDQTYYESVVDSKPGDLKHAELVSKLADEGQAYLNKKTKK